MHLNYAGSNGHPHPVEASRSARRVQESEQHGALGDVSYGDFWPYASSASHEDRPFSWPGDQESQQMGHFPSTVHSALPPAYNDMLPPPNAQANDLSFGQYAQSSSQQFAMSLSNEHSPSFSLNNDLYGSPEGFDAASQFPDLNIMPTTQPSINGMSLQSFPNIVEDEDGMFHIE